MNGNVLWKALETGKRKTTRRNALMVSTIRRDGWFTPLWMSFCQASTANSNLNTHRTNPEQKVLIRGVMVELTVSRSCSTNTPVPSTRSTSYCTPVLVWRMHTRGKCMHASYYYNIQVCTSYGVLRVLQYPLVCHTLTRSHVITRT